MNPQAYTQACSSTASQSETAQTEMELLVQWGFNAEETTALLWLRQWYASGGSDRALVVRHLEFLKFLIRSGELEL